MWQEHEQGNWTEGLKCGWRR